ncbi:hypothetical protein [Clostridium gasigenes]|uniref:hypothetical protein n=1 Tax=Clostridium gasigenes TaxID=94869 RepID=UPI001C0C6BE7|nr:hypothetical protein [Clostridium gasigenes]MBU3107570.1 hypothetical protein [Clostridium gasigenes]
MEIHVTDNAMNSLEVGLEFYNKFLDNLDNIDISVSHFGNLKFTVIGIHNAIELLTKSILLDINELIVFKVDIDNDPALCYMLNKQFGKNRRKAHIAYNAVFSTNDYKTIEYSKTISLIKNIFNNEISNEDYNVLVSLGNYRNTLTHLGYASIFEWYKILVILNKTLKLILEFYVDKISKSEQHFSREILNQMNETILKSGENINDIWLASNEATLEGINEKIDGYFEENIEKMKIKQDEEYGFYESIDFIYTKQEKDIHIKWDFKYSYLNEAIIIIDDNKKIVSFISIESENLKYLHDENDLPIELEKIWINVPKKIMLFEDNKVYKFIDKSISTKLDCIPGKVNVLIEMYLKNR